MSAGSLASGQPGVNAFQFDVRRLDIELRSRVQWRTMNEYHAGEYLPDDAGLCQWEGGTWKLLARFPGPGRYTFHCMVRRALRDEPGTWSNDTTVLEGIVDVEEGARAADADRAEVVLRAAQEGLTNAVRHAQAQNVWLRLARGAGGALELTVEDDGRFEGVARPGNGLAGVRERLQAVSGALEIDRGPRGGLRLAAVVPGAVAP